MRLMKSILALVLAMLTLMSIPAFAEEPAADLVKQDPLLDAAFSMLEKGNPILEKYNEITGADVQVHFEYGLPYFFGGTYDFMFKGEPLLFSREPEYARRSCWEQTKFYDKNKLYLYGLDCSGYTRWIFNEVGWPRHDSLSGMINQYGKYEKKNHVYSHRRGKEMPPYSELAATLELGDLLVVKPKEGGRHVMMFIGTLREYGYTAETVPALAAYLDYPLVIHCGPNPMYGARMQKYLDEHADDSYYKDVKVPNGGVCVSLIGVPLEAATHRVPLEWLINLDEKDPSHYYHCFDLNGYDLTIWWELDTATSFCWFRINGIK